MFKPRKLAFILSGQKVLGTEKLPDLHNSIKVCEEIKKNTSGSLGIEDNFLLPAQLNREQNPTDLIARACLYTHTLL